MSRIPEPSVSGGSLYVEKNHFNGFFNRGQTFDLVDHSPGALGSIDHGQDPPNAGLLAGKALVP